LSFFFVVEAKEFLYPVAVHNNHGVVKIYLVYQKSVEHLELLVWDPVTKETDKGLLSTYTPGVFKILPGGSGFSFVDKGRILVKSFTKRSPKSVAFYAPIDDIALIHWIDDSSFYFMAKESKHYSLFHANAQGDLHVVAKSEYADYMYPQKVDDSLFFLRRVKQGDEYHYSLVAAPYPLIPNYSFENDSSAYEQIARLNQEQLGQMVSLVSSEDIEPMLDLGEGAASFLTMVSPRQGFYVEHPRVIERSEACVPFSYYQLDKKEQRWEKKKLFSFRLPTHFFLEENEFRLYESLLPLLPRHTKNGIFFTDCYDTNRLKTGIAKYDLKNGSLTYVSSSPSGDIVGDAFFAPLCVGAVVFYGGVLLPEDFGTGNRLPAIWINEDGRLCVDLPVTFDSELQNITKIT